MNYRKALLDMGVDSATADEFWKWHDSNREVWALFEAAALKLIQKGKKHFGAKAIMEHVRYCRTQEKPDFAVNNNYAAYYARIFQIKYPAHKNFFRYRKIQGLGKAKQTASITYEARVGIDYSGGQSEQL